MSESTLQLTEKVYAYFKKHCMREPKILTNLREETSTLALHRMQISSEQGQLIRLLIEILGAKKTLDIGTFTGYSALSVAIALPEDGKVIACDINVEWTNIAKRYFQMAHMDHKIDLKLAPALQTLDNLLVNEKNTFDFAFIDADKMNYSAYYEKSLSLLRPGGLIALDNVLWSGKVADDQVNDKETIALRQLNEIILADNRVNMCMLPVGDGLTLARKN